MTLYVTSNSYDSIPVSGLKSIYLFFQRSHISSCLRLHHLVGCAQQPILWHNFSAYSSIGKHIKNSLASIPHTNNIWGLYPRTYSFEICVCEFEAYIYQYVKAVEFQLSTVHRRLMNIYRPIWSSSASHMLNTNIRHFNLTSHLV